MKTALVIVGLLLASIGGVIAYRALFLEPTAAVVITSSGDVRELPNTVRIVGGAALVAAGAAIAFLSARRRRR